MDRNYLPDTDGNSYYLLWNSREQIASLCKNLKATTMYKKAWHAKASLKGWVYLGEALLQSHLKLLSLR